MTTTKAKKRTTTKTKKAALAAGPARNGAEGGNVKTPKAPPRAGNANDAAPAAAQPRPRKNVQPVLDELVYAHGSNLMERADAGHILADAGLSRDDVTPERLAAADKAARARTNAATAPRPKTKRLENLSPGTRFRVPEGGLTGGCLGIVDEHVGASYVKVRIRGTKGPLEWSPSTEVVPTITPWEAPPDAPKAETNGHSPSAPREPKQPRERKAAAPRAAGAGRDRFGNREGTQAAAINAAMTAAAQTVKEVQAKVAGGAPNAANHLKWLVERGFAEKDGQGYRLKA